MKTKVSELTEEEINQAIEAIEEQRAIEDELDESCDNGDKIAMYFTRQLIPLYAELKKRMIQNSKYENKD